MLSSLWPMLTRLQVHGCAGAGCAGGWHGGRGWSRSRYSNQNDLQATSGFEMWICFAIHTPKTSALSCTNGFYSTLSGCWFMIGHLPWADPCAAGAGVPTGRTRRMLTYADLCWPMRCRGWRACWTHSTQRSASTCGRAGKAPQLLRRSWQSTHAWRGGRPPCPYVDPLWW